MEEAPGVEPSGVASCAASLNSEISSPLSTPSGSPLSPFSPSRGAKRSAGELLEEEGRPARRRREIDGVGDDEDALDAADMGEDAASDACPRHPPEVPEKRLLSEYVSKMNAGESGAPGELAPTQATTALPAVSSLCADKAHADVAVAPTPPAAPGDEVYAPAPAESAPLSLDGDLTPSSGASEAALWKLAAPAPSPDISGEEASPSQETPTAPASGQEPPEGLGDSLPKCVSPPEGKEADRAESTGGRSYASPLCADGGLFSLPASSPAGPKRRTPPGPSPSSDARPCAAEDRAPAKKCAVLPAASTPAAGHGEQREQSRERGGIAAAATGGDAKEGGGASRAGTVLAHGGHHPSSALLAPAPGGGMRVRDFMESRWMGTLCEESLKFHLLCGRYRPLVRHVIEKFQLYVQHKEEEERHACSQGSKREKSGGAEAAGARAEAPAGDHERRLEGASCGAKGEVKGEEGEDRGTSAPENCHAAGAVKEAPIEGAGIKRVKEEIQDLTLDEDTQHSVASLLDDKRCATRPCSPNPDAVAASADASLKDSLLYPLPPPAALSASSPLVSTPYRVPVRLILRGLLPHPPTSPAAAASSASSAALLSSPAFVFPFLESAEEDALQQAVFERLYANRDATWCRRYFWKYQNDFDVSVKVLNQLSVLLPLPILKKLVYFHARIKKVWPMPVLAWISSSSRAVAMMRWGRELDALERCRLICASQLSGRAGSRAAAAWTRAPVKGRGTKTAGALGAIGKKPCMRFFTATALAASASTPQRSAAAGGPCDGADGSLASGTKRKGAQRSRQRKMLLLQQRRLQPQARVRGAGRGARDDDESESRRGEPDSQREENEDEEESEESCKKAEKEANGEFEAADAGKEGCGKGEESGPEGQGSVESSGVTELKKDERDSNEELGEEGVGAEGREDSETAEASGPANGAATGEKSGGDETEADGGRAKGEELEAADDDGQEKEKELDDADREQDEEKDVKVENGDGDANDEKGEEEEEDDAAEDANQEAAEEDKEDQEWRAKGFAGKVEAQLVRDMAEHLWRYLETLHYPPAAGSEKDEEAASACVDSAEREEGPGSVEESDSSLSPQRAVGARVALQPGVSGARALEASERDKLRKTEEEEVERQKSAHARGAAQGRKPLTLPPLPRSSPPSLPHSRDVSPVAAAGSPHAAFPSFGRNGTGEKYFSRSCSPPSSSLFPLCASPDFLAGGTSPREAAFSGSSSFVGEFAPSSSDFSRMPPEAAVGHAARMHAVPSPFPASPSRASVLSSSAASDARGSSSLPRTLSSTPTSAKSPYEAAVEAAASLQRAIFHRERGRERPAPGGPLSVIAAAAEASSAAAQHQRLLSRLGEELKETAGPSSLAGLANALLTHRGRRSDAGPPRNRDARLDAGAASERGGGPHVAFERRMEKENLETLKKELFRHLVREREQELHREKSGAMGGSGRDEGLGGAQGGERGGRKEERGKSFFDMVYERMGFPQGDRRAAVQVGGREEDRGLAIGPAALAELLRQRAASLH
ncbi:hypothetical protein BESB_055510 [Besnoitia besnoiti]|uniref:Uncharacterized protein n=1 Tax=Besnoitia besnoiti TaxID=94643 RepID=A0A2A9MKE4_BESBE|nr:hypothetical protein BESB_055510 [Besnoitia besnoiti]PFH35900.1 hypothetical protein BESB_055510 [Besnoitia besnoiti]